MLATLSEESWDVCIILYSCGFFVSSSAMLNGDMLRLFGANCWDTETTGDRSFI